MNVWEEINAENESDHEYTLRNEVCPACGNVLIDHYDQRGQWVSCDPIIRRT